MDVCPEGLSLQPLHAPVNEPGGVVSVEAWSMQPWPMVAWSVEACGVVRMAGSGPHGRVRSAQPGPHSWIGHGGNVVLPDVQTVQRGQCRACEPERSQGADGTAVGGAPRMRVRGRLCEGGRMGGGWKGQSGWEKYGAATLVYTRGSSTLLQPAENCVHVPAANLRTEQWLQQVRLPCCDVC